jgi:mannose-6-phosphate isomerase-like protein (cupin superfamily)
MFKVLRTMPPLLKRPSTEVVTYEDGISLAEFYVPGDKHLGRQVLPPDNKLKDGSKSFMAPVSHIHLLQDEIFHVKSGEGIWYMRGRKPIRMKAGDGPLVVPQFLPHRFENVPGSTEPLVIEYNYDASMREMEMRFFYNVFAYLDDCQRAKMAPSILQLCVFCSHCWMPVDLGIPGPDFINLFLSTLFMYTASVIGQYVLGYKASYPEYYQREMIDVKKSF